MIRRLNDKWPKMLGGGCDGESFYFAWYPGRLSPTQFGAEKACKTGFAVAGDIKGSTNAVLLDRTICHDPQLVIWTRERDSSGQ